MASIRATRRAGRVRRAPEKVAVARHADGDVRRVEDRAQRLDALVEHQSAPPRGPSPSLQGHDGGGVHQVARKKIQGALGLCARQVVPQWFLPTAPRRVRLAGGSVAVRPEPLVGRPASPHHTLETTVVPEPGPAVRPAVAPFDRVVWKVGRSQDGELFLSTFLERGVNPVRPSTQEPRSRSGRRGGESVGAQERCSVTEDPRGREPQNICFELKAPPATICAPAKAGKGFHAGWRRRY